MLNTSSKGLYIALSSALWCFKYPGSTGGSDFRWVAAEAVAVPFGETTDFAPLLQCANSSWEENMGTMWKNVQRWEGLCLKVQSAFLLCMYWLWLNQIEQALICSNSLFVLLVQSGSVSFKVHNSAGQFPLGWNGPVPEAMADPCLNWENCWSHPPAKRWI